MKEFKVTCQICGKDFLSHCATANLCSPECRRERKHQTDLAYRQTEQGQAVRRKNRKSPKTIETRKRYEQTQRFKESKHARNKIYMQGQRAQDLGKMRKLNYYYSHFSKKYNLYKADAYKVTLEDIKKLYGATQCFYCSKELTEDEKTVDHKLPVSKGGTNEMTNLVICCQTCNSKKRDQTAEEYRSAS